MAPAPGGDASGRAGRAPRELQLESRHLAFLIGLVLALCVASFMLGRWVERESLGLAIPQAGTSGRSGDAIVQDMGEVSKDLTFFDTLKGGEPAPLQASPAPRGAASVAQRAPDAPESGGPRQPAAAPSSRRSVNEGVMIQVFASKDRAVADAVRRKLRAKRYTALLVSEGGSWKVRVGPYADREEAERSATILREQENLKTWIP